MPAGWSKGPVAMKMCERWCCAKSWLLQISKLGLNSFIKFGQVLIGIDSDRSSRWNGP